jgi:hypothetical protein
MIPISTHVELTPSLSSPSAQPGADGFGHPPPGINLDQIADHHVLGWLASGGLNKENGLHLRGLPVSLKDLIEPCKAERRLISIRPDRHEAKALCRFAERHNGRPLRMLESVGHPPRVQISAKTEPALFPLRPEPALNQAVLFFLASFQNINGMP